MTIEQRGSAGRTLLESLGLDPDQPLIEWHGWIPPHYETPEPPPPPPPPAGRIRDTFTRADGPLTGTLTDSGHKWVANAGSTIVGGQGKLSAPSGSWQSVALAPAGAGVADPTTVADTVTLSFELSEVTASSGNLWVCPSHVNATNTGIIFVQASANQWFAYTGRNGALSNFALLTMTAPMVSGAAPRRLEFTYTRSTGVASIYENGVLSASATVPVGNRAALVGASQPYFQVGNGSGQVYTIDNLRVTDSGPVPNDPPPPAEPVPVYVPGAWSLHPERTAALSTYQVAYGRQDPADTVGPLQASAVVLVREKLAATALPVAGERFRLTISAAAAAVLGLAVDDRPRFTGEVTDVDVGTDGRVQAVGVGRRARLGRTAVGTGPWPAELDGARVARILNAVKTQLADLDVGVVDDGTAQLLARVAAPAAAATVLDQVIESTGGQLVEQRTGALDWHDADHRRGAAVAVVLSGDVHLLRPFRWSQGIGGIVNVVDVGYGEPSAVVRVVEPNSADVVDGMGPLGITLATLLADQDAAYARASDIVGRRAWPAWRLPVVSVDLVRTAGAAVGPLLKLRHGDLIDVSALPADGPYLAADVFVEGAVETMTRTAWRLSLSVADQALAGVAPRWIDVPAAVTWDTTDPTVTWLDAATVDPATF